MKFRETKEVNSYLPCLGAFKCWIETAQDRMDGHVYIFQSSNLRLFFPAFSFLLQTFPQMPLPLHQARTTPYQPSKAEPLLLAMTRSQCSLFFLPCLYVLPFWEESCRHTKAYCQKKKTGIERQGDASFQSAD